MPSGPLVMGVSSFAGTTAEQSLGVASCCGARLGSPSATVRDTEASLRTSDEDQRRVMGEAQGAKHCWA